MKLVKIIEKLKEQGLLVSYEGNLDIEIENVYAKQLNIDTVSGDVDIAYTNASVKTTAISADVNVGKEKN